MSKSYKETTFTEIVIFQIVNLTKELNKKGLKMIAKFINNIKRYFWYMNRYFYLKNFEIYTKMNLKYFEIIRSDDPFNQQIGLSDFNMTDLPRINIKKDEKSIMGNSTYVMKKIVEETQKEFKKLQRWKNIKNIQNSFFGKVIFS